MSVQNSGKWKKKVLTLKSVQGYLEYKAQKQMEIKTFIKCWWGKKGPSKENLKTIVTTWILQNSWILQKHKAFKCHSPRNNMTCMHACARTPQYCKRSALSNLLKGTLSQMSLNLQAMDSGQLALTEQKTGKADWPQEYFPFYPSFFLQLPVSLRMVLASQQYYGIWT